MAVTRFAPSPTGELHIGGIRTALYCYALARKTNGKFILRMDDTDQKRFVPGADIRIQEDLRAYGLNWDEGPYYQTKRLDLYNEYIKKLLDEGHAYYCFCTEEELKKTREINNKDKKISKYDKRCSFFSKEEVQEKLNKKIPYVIRLNVPKNQTLVFNDLIRGTIKFNTNEVDDQVLIKSDGIPTYHFANVIDDHLMGITHVFRAEEWLTSTPKHMLIYQNLGWEMPLTGHFSVFLAESGKGKMSKRQGSTQARQFLEEGFLPEAMLNFLMLLGWNPGTEREFYTLEEFIKEFDISRLNKKAVVFDRKKLAYFNGYYIRHKTDEELFVLFKKFLPNADNSTVNQLIPILKERIVKLKDLVDQTKFLFEDVVYEKDLLLQKNITQDLVLNMLTQIKEIISNTIFTTEQIKYNFDNLIKKNNWNVGQFYMVLRVAICGVSFTPPIVECLPILGKEKTIHKLGIAISKLS